MRRGSTLMLVHFGGFFDTPQPPVPVGIVHGIDVSNFQDANLTAIIKQYNAKHVVVRMPLAGEIPSLQHAYDQLHSAVDNGATVAIYYWGYASWSPEASTEQALERWEGAHVGALPVLWPDIEEYNDHGNISCPNQDWTLRACNYGASLGQRMGVYSSDYMIDKWWQHWPPELDAYFWWSANYNYGPTLNIPSKYWSHVDAHQYRGSPIDLDVFAGEVTVP